jgi:hypothetical protein
VAAGLYSSLLQINLVLAATHGGHRRCEKVGVAYFQLVVLQHGNHQRLQIISKVRIFLLERRLNPSEELQGKQVR